MITPQYKRLEIEWKHFTVYGRNAVCADMNVKIITGSLKKVVRRNECTKTFL